MSERGEQLGAEEILYHEYTDLMDVVEEKVLKLISSDAVVFSKKGQRKFYELCDRKNNITDVWINNKEKPKKERAEKLKDIILMLKELNADLDRFPKQKF